MVDVIIMDVCCWPAKQQQTLVRWWQGRHASFWMVASHDCGFSLSLSFKFDLSFCVVVRIQSNQASNLLYSSIISSVFHQAKSRQVKHTSLSSFPSFPRMIFLYLPLSWTIIFPLECVFCWRFMCFSVGCSQNSIPFHYFWVVMFSLFRRLSHACSTSSFSFVCLEDGTCS